MGQEERLIELGALLRDRRDELGLRRSDVARRVGVTHAYIARIEDAVPQASGHRTRLSEAVLRRWTSALGMSAADRTSALELGGYAARSRSGLSASSVREQNAPYDGDAPAEHALVGELRALLDEAESCSEMVLAEHILGPLFALLRDRFTRAL